MLKKIDVSCYVQPHRESDAKDPASANGGARRQIHDPTYSAVLGYGFGEPKLLPPAKPDPNRTDR